MAIIGFVLLAAAAVFGIEIAGVNNFSVDVDAFNQVYATSLAVLFVAGVVTGLVAALGLMLIRDGLIRRRRIHLEAKRAGELRERHIAELEEEHAARHRSEVRSENGAAVDLREREPDRDLDLDRDEVTTF